MKAIVTVRLKSGVLDPQGKVVGQGLKSLGFDEVQAVRVGKHVEVDLGEVGAEASARDAARARVEEMCTKLLANTVIEDYEITLEG